MSTSPPPLPGLAPGKPPRNWLQRNLAWVLPLLLIAVITAMVLIAWRGFSNMEGHMQQDSPLVQANYRVTASEELAAVLGRPMRVSLLAIDSVNQADPAVPAVYKFEVSGPGGKRRVVANAQRVQRHWVYERFEVEQEGLPPLDLRTEEERGR